MVNVVPLPPLIPLKTTPSTSPFHGASYYCRLIQTRRSASKLASPLSPASPPPHCTACTAGWYGHDCARKQAGLPLEPSLIPQRSWLSRNVKEAVAALEPPPKPTRKRPLIYVYDLEPLYSQKMLQYRCGQGGGGSACKRCCSTGVTEGPGLR